MRPHMRQGPLLDFPALLPVEFGRYPWLLWSFGELLDLVRDILDAPDIALLRATITAVTSGMLSDALDAALTRCRSTNESKGSADGYEGDRLGNMDSDASYGNGLNSPLWEAPKFDGENEDDEGTKGLAALPIGEL